MLILFFRVDFYVDLFLCLVGGMLKKTSIRSWLLDWEWIWNEMSYWKIAQRLSLAR